MQVTSTRSNSELSSLKALHQGLAQDGGLFVPLSWPTFTLKALIEGDYVAIQKRLLIACLDDIDPNLIDRVVAEASATFNHPLITPLVKAGRPFVLELFHGPSAAFKDIALQILPRLLDATHSSSEKTLVLTATSGDTGSAALEGFKHRSHFVIAVLYPSVGISTIQRKQMTCVDADNVHVYGIEGNFDDAQKAVKELFRSEFATQRALSSANSINLGRLLPQIAYYLDSYRQLVEQKVVCLGDPIVVSVPTGNFGNILAAYYAKQLGLPIKRLICASNPNDVLTEFIQTGTYDALRDFHITSSPSMDILVSSNLERLLFELTDHNAPQVKAWMDQLKSTGRYTIDEVTLKRLQSLFGAHASSEEDIQRTIRTTYDSCGYVLDPHTAVAQDAALNHLSTNPDDIVIVTGTASPYKFPKTVLKALGQVVPDDDFDAMEALHAFTRVPIPTFLKTLRTQEEKHTRILKVSDLKTVFLKEHAWQSK